MAEKEITKIIKDVSAEIQKYLDTGDRKVIDSLKFYENFRKVVTYLIKCQKYKILHQDLEIDVSDISSIYLVQRLEHLRKNNARLNLVLYLKKMIRAFYYEKNMKKEDDYKGYVDAFDRDIVYIEDLQHRGDFEADYNVDFSTEEYLPIEDVLDERDLEKKIESDFWNDISFLNRENKSIVLHLASHLEMDDAKFYAKKEFKRFREHENRVKMIMKKYRERCFDLEKRDEND